MGVGRPAGLNENADRVVDAMREAAAYGVPAKRIDAEINAYGMGPELHPIH